MAGRELYVSEGWSLTMAAKSKPTKASPRSTPAKRAPKPSSLDAAPKTDASSKVAQTHGEELVAKISSGVTRANHEDHPGHEAHRKGYSLGESVKSLAHIYTPWGNLRVNGSGILAIAAWSHRLESQGKGQEATQTSETDPYTRGLTHR